MLQHHIKAHNRQLIKAQSKSIATNESDVCQPLKLKKEI
jgi:hypothetical protein